MKKIGLVCAIFSVALNCQASNSTIEIQWDTSNCFYPTPAGIGMCVQNLLGKPTNPISVAVSSTYADGTKTNFNTGLFTISPVNYFLISEADLSVVSLKVTFNDKNGVALPGCVFTLDHTNVNHITAHLYNYGSSTFVTCIEP